MNPRPVSVESAMLRAVATVNGRVRYPVFLFKRDAAADDAPLVSETLNCAASKDREKLLARLSEMHPELDVFGEVAPLLERLGAEAAAASVAPDAPPVVVESRDVAPWDEPVNGSALVNELVATLRSYVVMPREAAHAVSLWIIHTYAVDVADFTPYLLVTSPVRACGKSTLLDILEGLAFRPRRSDGMTAAALYRTIDKARPAILLDELDAKLRGDGGEALRGVLNSGFHRSGRVTICVGDDHDAKDFATFSAKVLSGIGRVWDTVESRSIPVRLARATPAELRRLRKVVGATFTKETAPLRSRCVRWVADHRDALAACSLPSVPEALTARQADIWRPLFAIADVVGGRWPRRARLGAIALHGTSESDEDHALVLLDDLRTMFDERRTDRLRSAAIVDSLVAREDRPWPEMPGGHPLSARGLAKLLGRFAVRPTTFRDADGTGKGYQLAPSKDKRGSIPGLTSVFARYLAPEPSEKPMRGAIRDVSVTSVTTPATPYESGRYPTGYQSASGSATGSVTRGLEGKPAGVTDVTDNPGVAQGPSLFDDDDPDLSPEVKAYARARRAAKAQK